MSKNKRQYVCNNCGAITHKWFGKCFDCEQYNTITEEVISKLASNQVQSGQIGQVLQIQNLNTELKDKERILSPNLELNRILGGGLVRGSVILIGGEPGIGKSTLLLQLVISLAQINLNCLYVTGEESVEQVKLRAKRLQDDSANVALLAETNLENIKTTALNYSNLDLIIIDSVQTICSDQISGAPGTVSQIKIVAHELIQYAKQQNVILILVGHVTKDGQIAGPKVLEHMVDTVLYFESDQNYYLRILRAIKNRFGGVGEIGVFEMSERGLIEVSNPSELFISARSQAIAGSSVFAAIEGSRPFLIEIQALLAPCNMPMPRRSTVGWDLNRLSMILAVLSVRCKINLANFEVYLNVAGGFRISEPAGDLAVAAAIISSILNVALPLNSVFFGEISLSGEVRPVSQINTRIAEAKKLGFDMIVLAQNDKLKIPDICQIKNLNDLKNLILNRS
jgi:DNA repair protein RadA/Sms